MTGATRRPARPGPPEALSVDSGPKRSKYGVRLDAAGKAARTVNGIVFDSKAEAGRYQTLVMLQRAGEIRALELQPVFFLTVGSTRVARYYADFRYLDVATGLIVAEDVKSPATRTPLYRLKKKWAEALYGIAITEVSG